MPKRGRSDDSASPSPSRARSLGSSSPPKRGRDVAASASLATSSTSPFRSHRQDRCRSEVSKRLRRSSVPETGGSTTGWADLPADILEMVFVKLTGSTLASAQVCYRWRISALSFPRPLVLRPARSGRLDLIVPTVVRPRGANIAESVAAEGVRSFSYITLPALGSPATLRLIGGSASVPLFIDDSHRRLVARRFVGPAGELPNALPETLLSINLPEGVASREIYCAIFAVGSSNTSCHPEKDVNKIKGVLLATKSCIFGIQVQGSRASSDWASLQTPLVARQKERKFITAVSFGGLTYFLDQTRRLLACKMDLFGQIHTDELVADGNELLNQNIRTLKTWILHLSLGDSVDHSGLLCLRYEYNHPRCFRFEAYDLVVGEVRKWRVRRELRDFCIFIGWGQGAEAFAYWHPERIGLSSGFIYEAGQGMRSYSLKQVYRQNAMTQVESSTWPFAIWIQQPSSVPYVPRPRRGIMAESLPPPAGDGVDAVEKDRDN